MNTYLVLLFLSCAAVVFCGGRVLIEIYTRLENLEKRMKEEEGEKS